MTDRFSFAKTWGAELTDGGARFRLWAPAQQEMSLVAEGSGAAFPMHQTGDGWFEVETDAVKVDEGYRFLLPGGMRVPDPAARAQISDVHGPSRLVDPKAYRWKTAGWKGRPWEETVFYELHTGAFTEAGTFDGVQSRLDRLLDLGITCIELMPVAQFAGNHGWGYDGVLPYAPHIAYGGPEGLKRLIDAAHERGLMMFLDVVYNHFGPDGNYLHLLAPDFFHPERKTPWGDAIAYEKPPVRRYFIDNVLYWLEEYHFDGLRFDAIDSIADMSEEPILEEMASEVRKRITDREVHLTSEDERNIVKLHERDGDGRPRLFTGEWNDDFHHIVHVMLTGETESYYQDYPDEPAAKLARGLAEGFIYQGEPSKQHKGKKRGVPSGHLPPTAFVNFIQNHDQVGNRALGERLTEIAPAQAVETALALLLLSPQIPLLWMGEEQGEQGPFFFFTDFDAELGALVFKGRRTEFAQNPLFADEAFELPDPNLPDTFERSKLVEDSHPTGFGFVKSLLGLRRTKIVPLLKQAKGHAGNAEAIGAAAARAEWQLGEARLSVMVNLGPEPTSIKDAPSGALLFQYPDGAGDGGELPPWSIVWRLDDAATAQ